MRRSREVIPWRVLVVVKKEMGWSKRYVFVVTSGSSSEKELHTVLILEVTVRGEIRVEFFIFVERFVEF